MWWQMSYGQWHSTVSQFWALTIGHAIEATTGLWAGYAWRSPLVWAWCSRPELQKEKGLTPRSLKKIEEMCRKFGLPVT